MTLLQGVRLAPAVDGRGASVLRDDALAFVAGLHREFGRRRDALLEDRRERQRAFDEGERPRFLDSTGHLGESDWHVPPPPADLRDRRVEITGPTDRKMLINALNSGAQVFMADLEDANSPSWSNMLEGQENLTSAIDGSISYRIPGGKEYRLGASPATLFVRPRGWHLDERHMLVGGTPVSASLFDFGLYVFRNAAALLARGSGVYVYLPKLENHFEARLWNDVFSFTEDHLGLGRGAIRSTVLIETITAAFEMDEILYALHEHALGLNAGRWDYIFSIVKSFREDPSALLPDRRQVTMDVPFMRAYSELLVRTCHRRRAYAIGGMAAFIPSRRDSEVNERALTAVREDKLREATSGFDGTWVAHPDLVPVAREIFDVQLSGRTDQLDRLREDVSVSAEDLLDLSVPGGAITLAGVANNIGLAIRYLASWLDGKGAVAISNLMEDTATAEIARAQVWQWVHHGAYTDDGMRIDRQLVARLQAKEVVSIHNETEGDIAAGGRARAATELFEAVAFSEPFVEFVTVPGMLLLP